MFATGPAGKKKNRGEMGTGNGIGAGRKSK